MENLNKSKTMRISEIASNGDWLNITLDDSRKVSVNTDKTPAAKELKEGQDITESWEIKEWKAKDGEIKLFLNEKKKGFPKRDYGLEKKFQALQAASRFEGLEHAGNKTKSDMVLQLADKYLKWLNG